MTGQRSRREWLSLVASLVPAALVRRRPIVGTSAAFDEKVSEIERALGGRLGAAFWDTHDGRRGSYRGTERFPMCSTFKLLAAAAVMAKVERGGERLDRVVHFGQDRILEYAPVTSKHVNDGMSVTALCAAAIEQSDNTAGNLLLEIIGGPAALTGYLRGTGDVVTRLDRTEPTLNNADSGDPRDTTSSLAMVETVQRLLVGTKILNEESRSRLEHWLVASTTGADRLRAGLPRGWRVGDKTGSGQHAATNDVGVAWRPDRKPLLIAVFSRDSQKSPAERNRAIADVARLTVTGS
jgi:beta-lactamase class A